MCAATPHQLDLLDGLDRRVKNADLNAMCLEDETKHTTRQVRDLLRLLDSIDHGGPDGRRWSIADLARILDWSPRKVERICAIAESYGVLAIERRRDPQGRQLPSEYSIAWAQVRRYKPSGDLYQHRSDSRPAALSDRVANREGAGRDGPSKMPDRQNDGAGRHFDAPPRQLDGHIKGSIPGAIELNSPLPSCADWGGVEEELLRRELTAAQDAIASARSRGLAPADVLALVAHFDSHPGAWGPGALFVRIRNHLPGAPAESGWMPMSAEYVARRRRERESERRRERDDRDGDHRIQAERDRRAYEDLERRVGEQLDALTREEFHALAMEAFRGNDFLVSVAMKGSARLEMLRVLEKRSFVTGH
jgi:hypothetical protein